MNSCLTTAHNNCYIYIFCILIFHDSTWNGQFFHQFFLSDTKSVHLIIYKEMLDISTWKFSHFLEEFSCKSGSKIMCVDPLAAYKNCLPGLPLFVKVWAELPYQYCNNVLGKYHVTWSKIFTIDQLSLSSQFLYALCATWEESVLMSLLSFLM